MLLTPQSLATTRRPSLWMRPRIEFLGIQVDERLLPGLQRNAPRVLPTRPCWGNRQGQCFEHKDTSPQPPPRRTVMRSGAVTVLRASPPIPHSASRYARSLGDHTV